MDKKILAEELDDVCCEGCGKKLEWNRERDTDPDKSLLADATCCERLYHAYTVMQVFSSRLGE